MNINDLQPGSYKPVTSTKLNIKNLPQGSVKPVQPTEEPQEGILKRIGKALISSERGLAETFGTALAAKKIKKQEEEETGQDIELQNQIQTRMKDPKVSHEQKLKLLKLSQELGFSAIGSIEAFQKTGRQVAGEALGTIVDVASFGTYGSAAKLAKSGKLLKKAPTIISQAGKAIKTLPSVGKELPKFGKIAKEGAKLTGEGMAIGYGMDVAQNLQENVEGAAAFKPGLGTAIGGLVPVGITGVRAGVLAGRKSSPRLINSLIGANAEFNKAVRMGRDPGETVAKFGITANNLEDLETKISSARKDVGEIIGNAYRLPENAVKVADYSDILKVLDDEIDGIKFTESNASYIEKLGRARRDIAKNYPDILALNPERVHQLKQDIASLRGFDFSQVKNNEFNKLVNKMYGQTTEKINKLIPELTELNDDFGGLLAAEKSAATKAERNMGKSLVSLPQKFGLMGGGIGAGIGVATGGIGFAPVIAGVVGATLDKLLSSTAVKTRLAKFLSGATKAQKQALLRGRQLADQRTILKAARDIGFDFSSEVKLDTSVKKLPAPAMRLPEKSPSTIKREAAASGIVKDAPPPTPGKKVERTPSLTERRADSAMKEIKMSQKEVVKNKIGAKKAPKQLFGGVAGIETYKDEEGNLKTRFNPIKGAMGLGGMVIGQKALKFSSATNKFVGLEGRTLAEISDKEMVLKPIESWYKRALGFWNPGEKRTTLGEIIEHKELFDNYPRLKDVTVRVNPEGFGASFNPNNEVLTINFNELRTGEKSVGKTIVHEIQHAIENIEDLAKGGNATAFLRKKEFQVAALNQKIENLARQNAEVGKLQKYQNALNIIENGEKISPDEMKKLIGNENSAFLFGLYKRLGGEQFAQQASKRINWGDVARKENPIMNNIKNPIIIRENNGIVAGKIAEKKVFKNFPDLSTKILGKLEGRDTVSKQFISDLTNSGELKQAERDIIRQVLETYKEPKILYRAGELNDVRKTGLFFSDHAGGAKGYENTGAGGKKANEYTLDSSRLKEAKDRWALLKELDPKFDKQSMDWKYVLEQKRNGGKLIDGLTAEQRTQANVEKKIKTILEKQGYDGVKYSGSFSTDQAGEYQIFNPDKISLSKGDKIDVQEFANKVKAELLKRLAK